MSLAEKIVDFEKRLAAAKVTITAFCDEAGIQRKTWYRWKNGEAFPHDRTWAAVEATIDRLAPKPQRKSKKRAS